MSNSFNISVKPEIKAVEDKVDDVDAVVDANKVILLDVQGAKITSILTAIGLNKTELDGIRGADLTSILTNIGVNTTALTINAGKLDDIKAKTNIIGASVALETGGNIADIKAKTDATPQKVRGKWYVVGLNTSSAAFVDICSISGQGKLVALCIRCEDAGDTGELKLTVDGTAWTALSHTGDIVAQGLVPYSDYTSSGFLTKFSNPPSENRWFNLEFNTTLLVQIRRSVGTAGIIQGMAQYILDDF